MTIESMDREHLLARFADRGYQGRVVSIRRLRDLQIRIETQQREGLFDDEFYRSRLDWFRFEPPEALANAQSLIVVAAPRPQTEATFNWHGMRLPLIIPPTYTAYRQVAEQVTGWLAELLKPDGYRVERALLPLKLLAVQSGLAAYGRNNICYVPGMGSFLELVGLYSDLPCPSDEWREPQMMDACQHCLACVRRCPSGAIPADEYIRTQRFLLHAERCIVFHNEKPGDVPFPAWMEPSWHNCLEGCMHCQWVCPEDQRYREWIEGREEFTEEETALLLAGSTREQLRQETIRKLERLDILDDLGILPRNLGVFMTP